MLQRKIVDVISRGEPAVKENVSLQQNSVHGNGLQAQLQQMLR